MGGILFLHWIVTILFPILKMIFLSHEMNYLAYSRLCMMMLIALLTYLTEKFFKLRGKGGITQNIQMILRYIEGILIATIAFNLLTYLKDFYTMVLVLVGYVFLTMDFLGNIYFSNSKYKGLFDTMNILMTIPVFQCLSKIIMFAEFDVASLVDFAPVNFCYFLLYLADSLKIEKDCPKENPVIINLALLLGRQDSNRILTIISFYLLPHIVIECVTKASFIPMIPLIICINLLYRACANAWKYEYNSTYRDFRKTYLLFVPTYLVTNVII